MPIHRGAILGMVCFSVLLTDAVYPGGCSLPASRLGNQRVWLKGRWAESQALLEGVSGCRHRHGAPRAVPHLPVLTASLGLSRFHVRAQPCFHGVFLERPSIWKPCQRYCRCVSTCLLLPKGSTTPPTATLHPLWPSELLPPCT